MRTLNSELNKIIKKYGNTKSLYIIIIIGVALMIMASGHDNEDSQKAPVYGEYSDETRLEEILEEIDGAGDVSVMITYHSTVTYDVAYERKETNSERSEEVTRSSENSVITTGGEPLIKGEVYPEVKGVVVIADGAGDVRVKKALTDACVAALDVASFKVCVLEGKERN